MGFFKLSAVFLLTLWQWEVHSTPEPDLKCPPLSSPGYISECEKTCANLLAPAAEVCTLKAIYTCKCDEGLLAQNGTSGETVQCVKPEQCKVPCGPNEHYDPCYFNCQPTCEQPTGPKLCTTKCSPGCVCDKGYVRSGKKCIKPTECKQTKRTRCPKPEQCNEH